MKEPETLAERADAIADYTNLLASNGWKRVVAQIDANIELVLNQLESGVVGEKLSDVKRLRDKIKLLRDMRNTPENMIKKLESNENVVANPDPYDTEEDIKKRKKTEELDTEEE